MTSDQSEPTARNNEPEEDPMLDKPSQAEGSEEQAETALKEQAARKNASEHPDPGGPTGGED